MDGFGIYFSIMATKGTQLVVLISFTSIVLLLLLLLKTKDSPPGIAVPPIRQITAYSLSNAPSLLSNAKWSTNVPHVVLSYVAKASVASNANTALPTSNKSVAVPFKNKEQEAAFDRLSQFAGGQAQLFLRPDNSTPAQIKGYPLMKAVASSGTTSEKNEATAGTFLKDYANLILLKDPVHELRVISYATDKIGMAHIRYAQTYNGLDVWPSQLSVHLDQQGDVTLMDGAYIETPEEISTIPQISKTESETRAKAVVADGVLAQGTEPTLIVYGSLDKPPRLAWKSEVVSGLQNDWIVVVDAMNGSTLTAFNQCADANVAGSGLDLLGQTRNLNVWQSDSLYYLLDTSKPMFNAATGDGFIGIYDARNLTEDQIIVGNTIQNLYYITSSIPTSWNNPDGVSAAYNFAQTYDYYYTRFGRSSYNGQGGNLEAAVRINSLPNAFWRNDFKMMFFGNADQYAASLDVIGHELTHGVTFSIGGNGVLIYQNQSGALNEAFSDIFGEMVEARTVGTNDWLIGSELSSPLRNISNPTSFNISGINEPYPSKMSEFFPPNDPRLSVFENSDNGGVHINSTIIGHAYYLLVAGLKGAIGDNNAEQIFYRCLTQSMQPQSQFVDARLGCIAAAEQLFGTNSTIALKTAEAFDAVEIYAAPTSADQPTSINAAVAASDSYMWVRNAWDWGSLSYKKTLYRFEAAQGDSSGTALVTGIKVAMPSISGNGSDMFFTGGDDSLCYIQTSGTGFSTSNSGQVHSVAWSPGQRYFAFVLNTSSGNPTNQIYIYDVVNSVGATVNLKTPVQDGPALNNISYADALDFSPDGKFLAYDALSTLKLPDGTLKQVWSVYTLSISNLQQSLLVPAVSGFSFGNPAFSKTSDRYLALDALYTNGNSAILSLDLGLGNLGLLGVAQSGLGYPQFNGNDSFIIYADYDGGANSGRSIYAQSLSADNISTNGLRSLLISDAYLATVYRRGTFTAPYTAPAVAITNPVNHVAYLSPANVTLTATASSPNGAVSRVEFYSGSKLLGTITSFPYSGIWTNVPSGNYRVYARVYDSTGASSTSAPIDFTVQPSGSTAKFVSIGGKLGFEFSLKVPQSGLYRLEYSTNFVNWTTLGSFQCVTNLNFFDTASTNRTRCFYRAVSTP